MCQVMSSLPSAFAISCARIVLPVPGSPFTKSGRSSAIAALTATRKSSVATYVSVPAKRVIDVHRRLLLFCHCYQIYRRHSGRSAAKSRNPGTAAALDARFRGHDEEEELLSNRKTPR